MTEAARYINVSGEAVQIGGGTPPAPTITLVSETHLNQTGAHAYSSITGLQAGDLMVLFTSGAYRVTSLSGWTLIADAGAGGTAVTVSVLAKFATSSSESLSASFTNSDSGNFSSLMVFRGPAYIQYRAAQSFSIVNDTAPLTFPGLTAVTLGTVPGASAGEALVLVAGAVAGASFTVSPPPTSTILTLATAGNRNQHLYRTPLSGSYSATPAAATYKAGAVVHLG
jgi:hypothetical protein